MTTSSTSDREFMARAIQLARLCGVSTSPNPSVGAVLVAQNYIIGEGYTGADGGPHAEVRAIEAARADHPDWLAGSTLYVTLEPCSIHGRTPPCAKAIIKHKIKRVVVGCIDFTPGVSGNGLAMLRRAGIAVELGVLQQDAISLALPRQVFVTQRRPYVILKQARMQDGTIGSRNGQLHITGKMANVISHQWRADCDAILIGVGTAVIDSPSLTTRYVKGASPLRVLYDPYGTAPRDNALFMDGRPTIWAVAANDLQAPQGVRLLQLSSDAPLKSLLVHLHTLRIGKLLVEGGAATIQQFLDLRLWDEFRVWSSPEKRPIKSDDLVHGNQLPTRIEISAGYGKDRLTIYRPT